MTSKMADDDTQPIIPREENEYEDEEEEEELSGCGATVCCDPKRPYHRYLVLIFMCFLSFGELKNFFLACAMFPWSIHSSNAHLVTMNEFVVSVEALLYKQKVHLIYVVLFILGCVNLS